MPTNRDRIRRYYTEEHDEWARLETDLGGFEWATATRRLSIFLPPPPARILDVGGGPGRYALWLASRGYEVTLVDLVPRLVDEARDRARDAGLSLTAILGDAAALTSIPEVANAGFDAAISFGPFYHLVDRLERAHAAAQLRAVCRPSAPVAIMLLNRLAGFLDGLAGADFDTFGPEFHPIWERILAEGVYENPGVQSKLFVDNYSVFPSEAVREVEGWGFNTESLIGVEGMLARFGPGLRIAAEDEHLWAFLWSVSYRLEEHPDTLVLSPHLLWLGRT